MRFASVRFRLADKAVARLSGQSMYRRPQFHLRCNIGRLYIRRSLVTEISPTTSLLRADESDNEVFLIGTAHISEASADEVKDLISVVQPETVFVELDPARAAKLRYSSREDDTVTNEYLEKVLKDMLRGGGVVPEQLLGATLSGFYGVLKRYGYFPGGEMLAAMQEGERVGAKLFYGDRNIQDILRELTAALNPFILMKAMSTPPPPELEKILSNALQNSGNVVNNNDPLTAKVEALKTKEHARLMTDWMERAMPTVADVMIHRRDKFMAQNLRKHCSKGKVVAVVGIAHVDGILRQWQKLAPKVLSA